MNINLLLAGISDEDDRLSAAENEDVSEYVSITFTFVQFVISLLKSADDDVTKTFIDDLSTVLQTLEKVFVCFNNCLSSYFYSCLFRISRFILILKLIMLSTSFTRFVLKLNAFLLFRM